MNKKLILKLLLLLLSLSLISCGKKDNIYNSNNETQTYIDKEDKEDNTVNTNSDAKEETNINLNETQSSINKEENTPKPNTNTDVKEETNIKQDVKQSLTQEEYYKLIKEAKKRQQDYIDSIDDPNVKQSLQTSYSAAVAESTALYIKYPDDTETIDSALKRVLNGE